MSFIHSSSILGGGALNGGNWPLVTNELVDEIAWVWEIAGWSSGKFPNNLEECIEYTSTNKEKLNDHDMETVGFWPIKLCPKISPDTEVVFEFVRWVTYFGWFEGQTHSGTSWHAKNEFDSRWADVECYSFKPPHYLQACITNLLTWKVLYAKQPTPNQNSCWVWGQC